MTTETANGSAAKAVDVATLSAQQLKDLRSQIAKLDRAKSKEKIKPAIRPVKEVKAITLNGNLIADGMDFDAVDAEVFSFDTVPTELFVKSGKGRAKSLRTGKNKSVGAAIVYRVIL